MMTEDCQQKFVYDYLGSGNTSVRAVRTSNGLDFCPTYEETAGIVGEPIGDAVTCDVWWFTAMDFEWMKTGYQTDNPESLFEYGEDFCVLDVAPGTYVFKMDYQTGLPSGAFAEGTLLNAAS